MTGRIFPHHGVGWGVAPECRSENRHDANITAGVPACAGGDVPTYQQAQVDAEVQQGGAGKILPEICPERTACLRGVRDALQAVYLKETSRSVWCGAASPG